MGLPATEPIQVDPPSGSSRIFRLVAYWAGVIVVLLGVAAFALSGAVVGTLLPQVVAGAAIGRSDPLTIAAGIAGAAITAGWRLYPVVRAWFN